MASHTCPDSPTLHLLAQHCRMPQILLDCHDVRDVINLLQAGPTSPLNPNAPEFTPASSRGATPGGSPKHAAEAPAADNATAADGGSGQPQPMEGITVAIKPQVGLPVPQAQQVALQAPPVRCCLRLLGRMCSHPANQPMRPALVWATGRTCASRGTGRRGGSRRQQACGGAGLA
jgi:Ataxin-2 C-terminal region